MNVDIKAIEYFLPERVEDNNVLSEDNPDWDMDKIFSKVGVTQRHIAEKEQCASDLGLLAIEQLLENSSMDRTKIDGLIVCTQSPDYFLPTTACILQNKLKLSSQMVAFDINLGCSGYIYGLSVCAALIESKVCTNILFLCMDTYSKYIDKHDRACRPIFGDGAAVTYIESSETSIGPFVFGTDGEGGENLNVLGGGLRNLDQSSVIRMNGPEVYMFTMREIPKCVYSLLQKANMDIGSIDCFIFHQAGKFVLDEIVRQLSLPEKKVFRGYENIGNMVSSSIPIALKQADEQGFINSGDQLMLIGFGVGYSWGGCLMKWNGLY